MKGWPGEIKTITLKVNYVFSTPEFRYLKLNIMTRISYRFKATCRYTCTCSKITIINILEGLSKVTLNSFEVKMRVTDTLQLLDNTVSLTSKLGELESSLYDGVLAHTCTLYTKRMVL